MIKLEFPDYYEKFICIADRCEKTCCAAWQVVVDEKAKLRYENETSPIGDRLRQAMYFDGEDTVFRLRDGRCPFLDERNLCDLYSALGKRSLCCTCEKYPRFETDFGGRKELGLSVSCPTAARLILQGDSFAKYQVKEENVLPNPNQTDPELYFSIMLARKHILEILHSAEDLPTAFDEIIEFSKRLQKLTESDSLLEKTRNLISRKFKFKSNRYGETCLEDLLKLERLDTETEKLIVSRINSKPNFDLQSHMLKRFFEYCIYRYFSSAVFDGDILAPISFSVFSTCCVAALLPENATEDDVINICVAYSREVEHSQQNIDTIRNAGYF